MLTTDIF